MLEAEVIGLREYSGPLYVKMNGSLRVVGAHVKMVVTLPCALKNCTRDVTRTFKKIVAEVAGVERKVVSIDSVSEVLSNDSVSERRTGTRIEFRVGVAPEKKKADEVRKNLTQSGINDGLAAKKISAVEVVEEASLVLTQSGINDGLAAKKISAVEVVEEASLLLRCFSNISAVEVVEETSIVALPDHLKGNRYVNTIYACSSGMHKIAQVSRIPRGRLVFRGTGGVKLPYKFIFEKEGGGRGGVDYGVYVLLYSYVLCMSCFYVSLLLVYLGLKLTR
jgi:hypothetical protein